MRTARRFLRLSASDRRLLIRTYTLLWSVRLRLSLLGYPRVVRSIGRARPRSDEVRSNPAIPIERISWAVRASARRVPGARCLSQALAAQKLLLEEGHPARLCIGIPHDEPRDELTAHAWVESAGRIIVGGGDLERFVELRPPPPM